MAVGCYSIDMLSDPDSAVVASLQTPAEAARAHGLCVDTVRRWAQRAGLGRQLGGSLVLTPAEVARILELSPRRRGNPAWQKR